MICRHIAWQRQFPGTIKFNRTKKITFAFKSSLQYRRYFGAERYIVNKVFDAAISDI